MKVVPLSSLLPMDEGIIVGLNNSKDIKRRLQDIGFTQGTRVACMYESMLGDPVAYKVKGTTVALRKSDADNVLVNIIKEL